MAAREHDERARKLVHIAFGFCALTLRYLSWPQAALLATAALVFNVFVLPQVAGHLFRPRDRSQGGDSGIILYPAAVLALVLVFRERLDIVAGAWAILAFGDGMATIAGRTRTRLPIPWNPRKSWNGTSAFILCGGASAALAIWWCQPNIATPSPWWFIALAPAIAAIVAAAVETIPVKLDDNLSVPAAAALVLWAMSLVDADLLPLALAAVRHAILLAAVVNVVVAWIGYRARTVTAAGAVSGALIGIAIAVTTGWAGWALLVATFLAAAVSSRLGLRRKSLLGIAEERGGRRGFGNAVANTGFACAAAVLSLVVEDRTTALLAFTAALAAGGSDTIASEIGKAWGRRTYLVSTLRPVVPGTSGAMSLEGTAAGVAGAVLLGGIGVIMGLVPANALLAIVAGATVGSFVESLLGATLEGPGILNNDMLNFLNTAVAAAAAIAVARLTSGAGKAEPGSGSSSRGRSHSSRPHSASHPVP
jgi:uncharacterized protein (TIGR00297 family)